MADTSSEEAGCSEEVESKLDTQPLVVMSNQFTIQQQATGVIAVYEEECVNKPIVSLNSDVFPTDSFVISNINAEDVKMNTITVPLSNSEDNQYLVAIPTETSVNSENKEKDRQDVKGQKLSEATSLITKNQVEPMEKEIPNLKLLTELKNQKFEAEIGALADLLKQDLTTKSQFPIEMKPKIIQQPLTKTVTTSTMESHAEIPSVKPEIVSEITNKLLSIAIEPQIQLAKTDTVNKFKHNRTKDKILTARSSFCLDEKTIKIIKTLGIAKSKNIICSENKNCKLVSSTEAVHIETGDAFQSTSGSAGRGRIISSVKQAVSSLSRDFNDWNYDADFQGKSRGFAVGSLSSSSRPTYKIVPRMPINTLRRDVPREIAKSKLQEMESIDTVNILKSHITCSDDKVVSVLIEHKEKFDNFIQNDLPQEHFFLVMQILKKVCDSKTKLQEKSFILTGCCNYKFLDQFANQIMKGNVSENVKVDILISNVLTFMETIVFLLPYTALDKAASQLKACSACVQGLKTLLNINISEKIIEKFEELIAELEKLKKSKADSNISKESFKERLQQQLPPDDFRNLSVEPTKEDVLATQSPFLRPNLVDGKYNSVDHYLDVQFRLLREDFMRPLREGIAAYKTTGSTSDTSVRVYKNVRFVPTRKEYMKWTENDRKYWFPYNSKERGTKQQVPMYYGTEVDLNCKHGKLEVLLESKKLMHGSLLCLTKNNFETILFATVSSTKGKELPDGHIFINFCCSVTENIYTSSYLMFECDVFFEPYYHVLNILRSINTEEFPMAKYLVEMSQEENLPAYLPSGVGLNQIIVRDSNEKMLVFDLLDKEKWPTAEELTLNPSQLQAFQAGLTKELAVIQGPPGTGKTFLALKIAQTLIENKLSDAPIIVVCLTNHALDQFLLGILEYTDKLVRIGGQSKVEELDKYNLKGLRINRSEWFDRLEIYHLSHTIVDFETFLIDIQHHTKDKIISFDTLNSYGVVSYAARYSICGDFLQWLTDETGNKIVDIRAKICSDEFLKLFASKGRRDYPYWNHDCYSYKDYMNDADHLNHQEILSYHEKKHKLIIFQDNLKLKIRELESKLQAEDQNGDENQLAHLFEELESVQAKLLYIQMQLSNRKSATEEEVKAWENINLWQLTYDERWKLYWHWIEQLERAVLDNLEDCRQKIKQLDSGLNFWDGNGYEFLKSRDVIGLTTTGMARLNKKMQLLQPEIVIVEEAAEVLESHIVASLTTSCKHLILIGDHKQLRPSTSVYQLAKQFDFDVSLFERLVRGRGSCMTLNVQHRMSPCIASLVSPSIYPYLKNHESTEQLEPVGGMPKRLFFLTHTHYEDEQKTDSNSRSNQFEANYATELCRYIVQQGYSAERITLLTTYVGQMVLIKRKTKKDPLINKVRVTVVDNFQGEENDIIVLSLVRSNPECRVGFLATENRVCVALSRARNGLFIVGNMECLAQASSVWCTIRTTLEEQEAIGTTLPISCQNHVENGITSVSCAEDFQKLAPQGGCTKLCVENLGCGHPCYLHCHVFSHCQVLCHVQVEKVRSKCNHILTVECYEDPDTRQCQGECEIPMDCEHECSYKCHISKESNHKSRYSCKQACQKRHEKCGHMCTKSCGEECGHCTHMIEHTFICGHSILSECYNKNLLKCNELIDFKLSCGHTATDICSKNSADIKCKIPTQKLLKCGHTIGALCGEDFSLSRCTEKCTKLLKCGHQCQKDCSRPCDTICRQQCLKSLTCGHQCKKKCYEKCGSTTIFSLLHSSSCGEKCDRLLDCGHKCKLQCCGKEKCKPCQEKVEKVIAVCGHKVTITCSEDAKRENCSEKCERTLECGHHACKEMCAEECKCYAETESTVPAPCGHQVKLLCFEAQKGNVMSTSTMHCSHPCGQQLLCGHTCMGTCGQCLQGRLHIPCLQLCTNKLICGHKVAGVCSASSAPCNQTCQYKCLHASCEKKCGEPCIPCKKACPGQCKHKRCLQRCGVVCNVPPCTEPCGKLLQCQHPCMGMCGDPCPPVCSICNPQLLQQLFIDETPIANQRVVQIPGCGHIVRNDHLVNAVQVCVPSCPTCEQPFFLTRFSQATNQKFAEVCKIQQRQQEYEEKSKDLIIQVLRQITSATPSTYISQIKRQCEMFEQQRKEATLKYDQQTYIALLVLVNVFNCGKNVTNPKESPLLCVQLKLILDFVRKHHGFFGQQQVKDLKLEIQRMHRLSQVEFLIRTLNKIKDSILNNEKAMEGKPCNDPTVKATKEKHKLLNEILLENSKFETDFNKFKKVVMANTNLPFHQDQAAADLLKSMSQHTQRIKKFQILLQAVKINPIPDILDARCAGKLLQ